jgi:hypothetical protein
MWPARIEDIDLIAGLPPLPPGHRILTTRGDEAEAMPALTVWRAGDDLRFTGVDYEATPDRLAEALAAVADGGEPNEADGVMTVGAAPPEVLICGHGRRDTCCGSFGIRLLTEVRERLAAGADRAWPGVRVRRCSHTGGHRFAPTGITLPEGRMWAFLDLDLLDAAVTGRPHPDLAGVNRGLMALDPAAQVAEGALFEAVGGTWRQARPRIERDGLGPGGDGGANGDEVDGATYRITWDGNGDGGGGGATRVEVRRTGSIPVPACGLPLDDATKSSPVYGVTAIDRD